MFKFDVNFKLKVIEAYKNHEPLPLVKGTKKELMVLGDAYAADAFWDCTLKLINGKNFKTFKSIAFFAVYDIIIIWIIIYP